jgi:hypothetical protein
VVLGVASPVLALTFSGWLLLTNRARAAETCRSAIRPIVEAEAEYEMRHNGPTENLADLPRAAGAPPLTSSCPADGGRYVIRGSSTFNPKKPGSYDWQLSVTCPHADEHARTLGTIRDYARSFRGHVDADF